MRFAAVALSAILAAAAATGAAAHTETMGDLQVVHPWVGPAHAGASTTAHPTLINKGQSALEVTKATSPAAARIELMLEGKTADTVIIEPGQTLSPQRFQLRLHDLKADLPAGKAVPVMLHVHGMEPMEVHMAIGQDTMNPEQVVELPGGHHGEGAEESH